MFSSLGNLSTDLKSVQIYLIILLRLKIVRKVIRAHKGTTMIKVREY